jgi:Ca2+-binding RTX toxin-like protein
MGKIFGTPNGDDLTGTTSDDTFILDQGGNDAVSGLDGNDIFRMGATLAAGDSLYGGTGTDKVVLLGAYPANFAFDASMLNSIEILRLVGDFDYDIIMHDANVAAGQLLNVNAGGLGAGHHLEFLGEETDGNYRIFDSAGDDMISTGFIDGDRIFFGHGGNDTFDGAEGSSIIHMADQLTADDRINAGSDFGLDRDRVLLNGDYTGPNALVLVDDTLVGVEVLKLAGGHSYDITTADGTVDSFTNLTLLVNGMEMGPADTLTFDGSAESDCNFTINCGAGGDDVTGGDFGDTINGRGGDDTIVGNVGFDFLTGGTGEDTYQASVAHSTSTMHDMITDFDADDDAFELGVLPSFVDTKFGSVNFATFDSDVHTICGDSLEATVLSVSGGDYAGRVFLVVDASGDGEYDGGVDFLFDVTDFTGSFDTGDFI